MEADWDVEIGPGAPIIEACWAGFVDLRRNPNLARQLPEAAQFPLLANSLIRLNRADSPLWTSKCDLWPLLDPGELDPYEMESTPQQALHGVACYIDLLPRDTQIWLDADSAIAWSKSVCSRLRQTPLNSCRTDLIVRSANLSPQQTGVGITAYLSACGPTPHQANRTLGSALAHFADVLCPQSTVE
jgi:hypothetical protein